jgi:hydrophobic/amphiphilic exporter-1 (mainly G- bacteria), HAE1 family
VWLFFLYFTEFIPPGDNGEISVAGEMEVGSRLGLVDRRTRQLELKVYVAVPETVSSMASVYTSGTRGSSKAKGAICLNLGPARDRVHSSQQIADAQALLARPRWVG